VRVLVDHTGKDESATWDAEGFARRLKPGDVHALLDLPGLREDLLPELVERAESLANQQAPVIASRASQQMHAALGREIARLTELQQVNPNVRPEEVAALVQQQAALAQHIQTARLRLDSVRLIRRGPS
jgi:ATP-dependent helicase HepA